MRSRVGLQERRICLEKEAEDKNIKADHKRDEMKCDKETQRSIAVAFTNQGKSTVEIFEFLKVLLQK